MEKDIALALKKEQEYLHRKIVENDNTANIYEYLSEAGYDNLEDYHKDGAEYYLKSQNLEIEHVYITEESLDEWAKLTMGGKTLFRSAEIEDPSLGTVAIVGADFNDFERYEELDVYPVKFNYMHGCIITGIKDFNFCISIPKRAWLSLADVILKKLKSFIETKNGNVEINGNDILVGGKKVVGCAEINNNGMCCIICHVSLTDYNDIIYKLCPPHGSKKEPGFITNITKKEFEKEVQSWLQL